MRAPTLSSIRAEQARVLGPTAQPTPQGNREAISAERPASSRPFPIFSNPSIRLPDEESLFSLLSSSVQQLPTQQPAINASATSSTPPWVPPPQQPVGNFEGPHFSQRRANYLTALATRRVRLHNRFKNSAYRLPGQNPSKQKASKTQATAPEPFSFRALEQYFSTLDKCPCPPPPKKPFISTSSTSTSTASSTARPARQESEWKLDETDVDHLVAVIEAQERFDRDPCHLYGGQ